MKHFRGKKIIRKLQNGVGAHSFSVPLPDLRGDSDLLLWPNVSQINQVYTIKDNDDSNRLQLELACSPQVESDTSKTAEEML